MSVDQSAGIQQSVDLSRVGALARRYELGPRLATGIAVAIPVVGAAYAIVAIASSGWHFSGIPSIMLALFLPISAIVVPFWVDAFGPYPTQLTVDGSGIRVQFGNGSTWTRDWDDTRLPLTVWDYSALPGKKPPVTLILVGRRARKIPLNVEAMDLIRRAATAHGLAEIPTVENAGTAYQIVTRRFVRQSGTA